MTTRQARRRLDRADQRLRDLGISNLGMFAIYGRPKHLARLVKAIADYQVAKADFKEARKGKR